MTRHSEDAAPAATTEDAFLGGALKVLQPRDGYRAGIDAVLLAAAAPVRPGETLLDAGAGVGVVGLCIAARVPHTRITLVESAPELVALAQENVERNGLENRIDVRAADVTASSAAIEAAGLAAHTFAHVVANPPFHIEGSGRQPKSAIKAAAHAMPQDSLAAWMRFAARIATADGTLTMIHRAEALGEVLAALDRRFGAIHVLPIHSRAHAPAIRVLVQGRKGSRAPLSLLPGLVLHEDGQGFRPEVVDILRHGAPLRIDRKV